LQVLPTESGRHCMACQHQAYSVAFDYTSSGVRVWTGVHRLQTRFPLLKERAEGRDAGAGADQNERNSERGGHAEGARLQPDGQPHIALHISGINKSHGD
jgi:hypothetical protein